MAEPTADNPLGLEPHERDPMIYSRGKILEAYQAVAALPNSREKSLILTKLDEARHWHEDLRLSIHYANGGH